MKSQHGFGLIELLFGMALASVICLGTLTLLESSGFTLKSLGKSADALEVRAIALEAIGKSLSATRVNLCGPAAVWRNHLQVSDAQWWQAVQRGIRSYGRDEVTPGTAFGTAASRRIAGTQAFDVHFFEPSSTAVLGQRDPDSELRVSSIQAFQVGDVAVNCSPISADVFMVTARSVGWLHHGAAFANGFGLVNCSASFHVGDRCTGAQRCIVGNGGSVPAVCVDGASIPATRIGKARSLRWYVGRNGQGEAALYSAEIENSGPSLNPTAVRPSEVIPGVSDLVLQVYRDGTWTEVSDDSVWSPGIPVRISLKLTDGGLASKTMRLSRSEAL